MNTEAENGREPMLNELCCLSVLGNVVYAARCARRMQPRFQLPATEPHADKMKAIVDGSIRWAEEYVQSGAGALEQGTALADAAAAVAQETCDETEYSAYAAYHSVRGATLAAQAGETFDEEVYMEIVAAAYGASRVLMANIPAFLRPLVVKALRADYDKLVALTLENADRKGPYVDPSESGPLGGLWQGKTPTW